jgi:hypothetical protein
MESDTASDGAGRQIAQKLMCQDLTMNAGFRGLSLVALGAPEAWATRTPPGARNQAEHVEQRSADGSQPPGHSGVDGDRRNLGADPGKVFFGTSSILLTKSLMRLGRLV